MRLITNEELMFVAGGDGVQQVEVHAERMIWWDKFWFDMFEAPSDGDAAISRVEDFIYFKELAGYNCEQTMEASTGGGSYKSGAELSLEPKATSEITYAEPTIKLSATCKLP